jgi:dATP pyrophosphohydrolase
MVRLRANLISAYLLRPASSGGVPLELLLLQRPDDYRFPGDWQAVHGHIEAGEPAWTAALRETAEETGLPVRRWWRLLPLESFYNAENDSIYQVPAFVGEVEPGAEPRISDEHQASRWCNLEEARSMFRWQTQQSSVDAIMASVDGWPQTGTGLMELDIEALERQLPQRSDTREAT